MTDWIDKLDDFLRLSDRQILSHAGKISHETAKEKAEAEYSLFQEQQATLPQPVDEHFSQSLDELKKIEGQAKKSNTKETRKPATKKRNRKPPDDPR